MDNEREYYVAHGADREKVLEFIEKRKAAIDNMNAIAKKFGGEAISNGVMITGLTFDGEPPLGWRRTGFVSGKECFMPRRDTKERKAIAKELDGPRVPRGRELNALFSKDGGVMKDSNGHGLGMRILFISYEYLGDLLLLTVPIGSDFKPDGSTPLKMSEYWSLKEKLAA